MLKSNRCDGKIEKSPSEKIDVKIGVKIDAKIDEKSKIANTLKHSVLGTGIYTVRYLYIHGVSDMIAMGRPAPITPEDSL